MIKTFLNKLAEEHKLIEEYKNFFSQCVEKKQMTKIYSYYYHITPIDLGQSIYLKPMQCETGSVNHLEPEKSLFISIKQLCVSQHPYDAIYSMFCEKFNTDEKLYVYKTVNKEISYSHPFSNIESKVFKEIKAIKVNVIEKPKKFYNLMTERNKLIEEHILNEDIEKDKIILSSIENKYYQKVKNAYMNKTEHKIEKNYFAFLNDKFIIKYLK